MNEHIPHHVPPVNASSNRTFGFVFTALFVIIALFPLLHGQGMRIWALMIAAIFLIAATMVPNVLSPLNLIWTKFGHLLHHMVGPVVLGFLFFFVVTPIAITLRLIRKDSLGLQFNKNSSSYWIERTHPGPDAESLKNQF